MFKREMKVYLKGFIIWTVITAAMYVGIFMMYPHIMDTANKESIDNMMQMFPEDILKSFNMDITSIDTSYGWLKSEGFVFLLLVTGAYAGILGANIIVKEESDKTIEYLNSLPVKRTNIVLSKMLCGVLYIIGMVVSLGLINYIGLKATCDFDEKQYLLLSITPLFSSLVIYILCMLVSTFTHKTKKMMSLSLGVVFGSYILQIVVGLSDKTEIFKYLTPYTLADVRNVIQDEKLNPAIIVVTVVLFAITAAGTFIHYDKKELV